MTEADKAKAQLVIVTGLLVLYFIFEGIYLLYAAVLIGVLCIAIPVVGDLIVKGWYKIAEVLGAINGRILLSVVFFIILFPIAVLSRIGKKKQNPLSLRRESERSVFAERNHRYTAKDLENVW
ncbi:hypothetical protein [Telluribacter sp.]|jgi:hypothetical protein|uniref:hypothetical protein n=1 Tax=Telluribacter sp. TaxID=1978767 RepID=UPI002E11D9A7|nr:hypothetical protein [Telluribacter sp.]